MGDFVMIRLEMRRDEYLVLRKQTCDPILDPVRPFVSFRNAQILGKKEVVFHPNLIVDLPMTKLMVIRNNPLLTGLLERLKH
jgi:hypothetical protein